MHELSLCQAILDHVDQRSDGRAVQRVEVRIGYLRQVVPDSLQFSWEMLTEGTSTRTASSSWSTSPPACTVVSCGVDTTLDWPVLACKACEGIDVELRSGEELELAWIDVADTVDVGARAR